MRVLVTGPAAHIDVWAMAGASAGWDPEVLPLIRTADTGVDLVERVDGLPDWLCITSTNALPSLERAAKALPELKTVPFAAVGEGTSERARVLGFKAKVVVRSAAELARGLIEAGASEEGTTRVLWPHGSLADELAVRLREAGMEVDDPVVYRVEEVVYDSPPPAADALQLASPSAARAWANLVGDARPIPTGIAIGPTTASATEALGDLFERLFTLDAPTPEAFEACLRDLAPPPS